VAGLGRLRLLSPFSCDEWGGMFFGRDEFFGSCEYCTGDVHRIKSLYTRIARLFQGVVEKCAAVKNRRGLECCYLRNCI